MEIQQTSCEDLNNFLKSRQDEILALAQKNTEEIVKRENALMEFELLLSVETPKKEQETLTKNSKKLREDSWKEISKQFNGHFTKISEFIDDY